jgi:hypothetical protein
VNPPSGCHFHTRCWLRERLGNPERCSAEVPLLRPLSTGHEVACHFAEEVDGSREQLQATGRGGAEPPVTGADHARMSHDAHEAHHAAESDESLLVRSPYVTAPAPGSIDLGDLRLPVQPEPVDAPDAADET